MKLIKGTKLYSIFTGTCPVCHEGDMYLENNPYKIFQIMKMYDHCSHCGIKFKMEPSFFFGAMYVSYAVGVTIAMAAFIIAFFFFGLDRHYTFLVISIVLVVTMPFIIRISRNIWINLFKHYDEKAGEEKAKS